MSWTWEAGTWKKSTKLLLLLATVWPIIYMVLFMSIILSLAFTAERNRNPCGEIDVLQLDRKIRNGEIKKLSIGSGEIVALATNGCKYEVLSRSDNSRDELLKDARETVNGSPRVNEIDEHPPPEDDLPDPLRSLAPLAVMGVMVLHTGTMLLMAAQMPFYIVLAVQNVHLEQAMRIVWIVLFAVVSTFAIPVYWYLHIWRKPKEPPIAPGVSSVP